MYVLFEGMVYINKWYPHRTVFTFRSLLDLLGVVHVLAVWISILKSSNHFTTIDTALQISQDSKNMWRSPGHILSFYSNFGETSCKEYVSEGITHPVFYGDIVYKLRRVKGSVNFVSTGSKIVKRLRRRKYDPVII